MRVFKKSKDPVKRSKSKKAISEKVEESTNIRKGTRPKRSKVSEDFVCALSSSESEANEDNKLTCARCEEILESDVEQNELKNLGCDTCPRWYHLKCTHFRDFSYVAAACKEFNCESCSG